MHPTTAAVALSLAALLAASSADALPSLRLEPCAFAGAPTGARCGSLSVPEDRASASGRHLRIHVVVLPATDAARRQRVPALYLAGGPGEAASDMALDLPAVLSALRPERDLVFVDFRGTGRSCPLACAPPKSEGALSSTLLDAERVRACAAALATTADLRRYTTLDFVADLEAVRAALGVDQVDLVAASYGTYAAQVYVATHRDRVRRMVLIGATPPHPEPLLFDSRDAARALRRTFDDCAAEAACAAAFPDPAAALARALAALPVTLTVEDPETHQPTAVKLDRGTFLDTLRTRLYSPEAAGRIPRALHRAATGDFTDMARAALIISRHREEGWSLPVFLSVMCGEQLPFVDVAAAERLAEGMPFGTARLRSWRAACDVWPHGAALPPVPHGAPTPALLLSGAFDPVTPPYWAEQVALTLPAARLVVLAGSSHFPDGPCAARLAAEFLAAGDVRSLDSTCAAAERRPPFAQ